MIVNPPYVVVVTSPASGVGKSTLATNLAVYLKALDEDLPVACLSLDETSEINDMFQIGERAGRPLSELLLGVPFHELLTFGEFGVEFIAPTELPGDVAPPDWLRQELAKSDYPGVLLIDAGVPNVLQQAAVWAADLLLVPVKDPADLPAVAALTRELRASGGKPDQLWLLPSELGKGGFSEQQAAQQEFLRFASEERGYQVLRGQFSLDSRAHTQACRQAKPVLTRLPHSQLHRQLHQIGELALALRNRQNSFPVRLQRWLDDGLLPERAARIGFYCPLCRQPVWSGNARYLEAYPCRRRLLLHNSCVALLLEGRTAAAFQDNPGPLLIEGSRDDGGRSHLVLKQFDAALDLLDSEQFQPATGEGWAGLLLTATGRCLEELYAETLLLSSPRTVADFLDRQWYGLFAKQRRELKRFCQREKI